MILFLTNYPKGLLYFAERAPRMKIKTKKRNLTTKEAETFLLRALKECREEIKAEKDRAAMGGEAKRREKEKRANETEGGLLNSMSIKVQRLRTTLRGMLKKTEKQKPSRKVNRGLVSGKIVRGAFLANTIRVERLFREHSAR